MRIYMREDFRLCYKVVFRHNRKLYIDRIYIHMQELATWTRACMLQVKNKKAWVKYIYNYLRVMLVLISLWAAGKDEVSWKVSPSLALSPELSSHKFAFLVLCISWILRWLYSSDLFLFVFSEIVGWIWFLDENVTLSLLLVSKGWKKTT